VADELPAETVETPQEDYFAQPVAVSDEAIEEVQIAEPVYVHEETEETEAVSVQEDDYSWTQPTVVQEVEAETESYQPAFEQPDYSTPAQNDYQFSETPVVETPQPEAPAVPQFESKPYEPVVSAPFEVSSLLNGKAETPTLVETFEPVVSQPVVTAPPPVKSRFSDRNVDLPIEVGEDERRLHNDARRFARLLVSEIKLYNEQKVKEGREAQDLYERLREAIDRSRDMYDKRVQPPVAAKFDYFHYELVSSLAEGEEGKLGGNYPGATV
ncbi:MAG TPA: hypothetical protein VK308_12295, partial [Pyrinomonadaceae bacterium]|nr:hypothetical protein [Pyrinomonadaceae bacterium]